MQKNIKSFDGTKINYDISIISKNFLVFLHGAGGDLTAWKKERQFFHRKGVSSIAIDLRGHGKSDRPDNPSDYKLENFARDINEVIKKENILDFILVGHCFGGMVAVMFHKLFPQKAKSYILIDTAYKAPSRITTIFKHHPFFVHLINHILSHKDLHKKYFSHVNFYKFASTGDWNFLRICSDISHTSFKSWLFTYENIAKFNGIKIMKSMKNHVLIIEGENDSIFDVLVAKRIKNLIKNSQLDIIPETNHIIIISSPKKVEEEIFKFIKYFKGF